MLLSAPLLSRLSHKRLMATFQVEAQRGEQDLYRCITLSSKGATISNFGELIVRGMLDLSDYIILDFTLTFFSYSLLSAALSYSIYCK